MPNNLQRLTKVLTDTLTKDEFLSSFENVVKRVKKFEAALARDFSFLSQTLTKKVDAAIGKLEDRIASVKDGKDYVLTEADKKEIAAKIDVPIVEKHTETIIKEQPLVTEITKEVPNRDTGDEIIDKINAAEKLIAKEAILGLDKLEDEIKEIALRPSGKGGAKGIGLWINGSKKLLTAQQINLIPGTGISLSYNHKQGRNDITISATGSGAFSVLAATGDVDDSNTSFTFASEPVLVVINGASYRHGAGVTISGTNVTTDNPIGTGGDIYAIG